MISFLAGKILQKADNFFVIEKGGIGFKVFASQKTLEKIQEGQEEQIYTYFCFRNEKPELYGFLTREELEIFESIEKISGVGPKAALTIASFGSWAKIQQIIDSQDYKALEQLKGVGRKKMQKIILELSGEIKKFSPQTKQKDKDVIKALTSLGFKKTEIVPVLAKLPKDIQSSEEKIKKALQLLDNSKLSK